LTSGEDTDTSLVAHSYGWRCTCSERMDNVT